MLDAGCFLIIWLVLVVLLVVVWVLDVLNFAFVFGLDGGLWVCVLA